MRSRVVTRADSKITEKQINDLNSKILERSKLSNDEDYEETYESGLKVRAHKSLINDEPVSEIRKGYHEGRYHTTRVGRYEMGASYKGSEERITAISVKENPAMIINITPDNFTIGIGETQVIAVKFNKAYLEDQVLPHITVPDNLELVTKFRLNQDRLGGIFTVKALAEGVSTIDCDCAGIVTSSRVTVSYKPVQKENMVYKDTKTDPNKPDIEVIDNYTANNNIHQVNGDVFVITLNIGGNIISLSSYIFMNGVWEAITGNVDASAVILRKDIILAGDYTKVGNISKGDESSVTYNAKGKSVASLIDEIFTKRLQPTIVEKPSIKNFNSNVTGIYEVGTTFTNIVFGENSSFDQGKYSFDKSTEVGIRSLTVKRIAEPNNMSKENISTTLVGVDSNEDQGFILGDMGGKSVVSKLRYEVEATHSIGAIARDNLGNISDPIVQIKEGTVKAASNEIRAVRKMFFGGYKGEATEVNSSVIRSLSSDFFENNKKFEFEIKAGTKFVIIACDKRRTGMTQIINKTALSADYTDVFELFVKPVEGANHYTERDYNVWIYKPLKPFEFDTTFEVTVKL